MLMATLSAMRQKTQANRVYSKIQRRTQDCRIEIILWQGYIASDGFAFV